MPITGTPVYDMLQKYLSKERASFHTPGHKGQAGLIAGLASLSNDLTELPETASLFDGGDVIEDAERLAADTFGAELTLFSAGGCTLCIQTMLKLAGAGGKVVFARNSHRSAVHAAALLGITPVWAWPTGSNGQITIQDIENSLKESDIRAVYITSPDYYGNIADIKGISNLCAKSGIPLLVDNAHGSHLGAFGLHPLQLGADMTADSCHKTLPVLTGGAMIHIGQTGGKTSVDRQTAKSAMALFGSTSPSFPVIASLDLARDWWQRAGVQAYRLTAEAVSKLQDTAVNVGISALQGADRDPARLTIDLRSSGIDGIQAAEFFREQGCEPEYADSCFTVFIITPFNTPEQLGTLERAIKALPADIRRGRFLSRKKQKRFYDCFADNFNLPKAVLTPRDALFLPCETVDTLNAAGRISASAVSPCPPGIAAVVPGEVISDEIAENLNNRGINKVVVVKT
jgi:arginine decarboxylase